MSAASDLRRFGAQLRGPFTRRAVDLAVVQVRRQVELAARKAVGGDLSLTGQRARLGVRVTTTPTGALVTATGPWALVERPRRGGYPIKPRAKGGALRVGRALYRASAVGGPITAPLHPWAKGTDAGRQPALDAVAAALGEVVRNA
jgi:hypothetical protein